MNDTANGFALDRESNQNGDMIQEALCEFRCPIERIYPHHHIFVSDILILFGAFVREY